MKFFVDTADVAEIRELAALGLLDGVTTNPSLVAKEGVDFHTRLREICEIVGDLSVSAEVIALDAAGMVEEGKELAAIAPNITVKVPMTPAGMEAVHTFSKLGITPERQAKFTGAVTDYLTRAGGRDVGNLMKGALM